MNRIPLKRIKGLVALWTVIFAVGAYEVHNNMVQEACAAALADNEHRIDQYSKDEADVFSHWLYDLTHPPAYIQNTWTPERSKWVADLGSAAYTQTQTISAKRQDELNKAAGHDRCV
jgi:hypothetical protein